MRRPAALLTVLLAAALPAQAQDAASYFGQVPLLPLAEGDQPDIDTLVGEHWKAYWRAPGALGFGRDNIRAGRFDLDGDGGAELFILIDQPEWQSDKGKPLLVASWRRKGWHAIGWAWADEDSVFATQERRDGWRTIDAGDYLLRWDGQGYTPQEKVL